MQCSTDRSRVTRDVTRRRWRGAPALRARRPVTVTMTPPLSHPSGARSLARPAAVLHGVVPRWCVGHGAAAAGEQYLELAASDSPADAARALHVALTVDEVYTVGPTLEDRKDGVASRPRDDRGRIEDGLGGSGTDLGSRIDRGSIEEGSRKDRGSIEDRSRIDRGRIEEGSRSRRATRNARSRSYAVAIVCRNSRMQSRSYAVAVDRTLHVAHRLRSKRSRRGTTQRGRGATSLPPSLSSSLNRSSQSVTTITASLVCATLSLSRCSRHTSLSRPVTQRRARGRGVRPHPRGRPRRRARLRARAVRRARPRALRRGGDASVM